MIALACVGAYILVGWWTAVRIYLHIEGADRRFARELSASYPILHPTQADRDRYEQEWTAKMAYFRYIFGFIGGLFWPFFWMGLVLKYIFDLSIARAHRA